MEETESVGAEVDRTGFPSDERFEFRRRLGAGGMGTVWAAWDRERQLDVALKALSLQDPEGIYRLKREFRSLADVTHENLVTLYELFASDGDWFFTMELLDGTDFIHHVRGELPEPPLVSATEEDPTVDVAAFAPQGDAATARSDSAAPSMPDLDRLRDAMEQLVAGVGALHAAGWLHRDIKPSNVMVTSEGRVVLLDFGIVAEMGERTPSFGTPDEAGRLVGTPSFMSPEQARGEAAGPESDWYSVGLLLYLALTGRRAFTGRGDRILEDKQLVTPPPLRFHVPEIPRELDELCLALLDRDPAARPRGRDILAVLGRRRRSSLPPLSRPPPAEVDVPLMGRTAQMRELRDAFENTRRGRCEIVLVHGTSGTGKTALTTRFLEEVAEREGAIVLAGRCYERESVPYKAVDSVVDELCGLLMEMPAREVRELVPEDADVLVQMFPVLRRVEELAAIPPRAAGLEALAEVRRRAFRALREILRHVARRGPLVVFVDDMQWGDADSAPLLEALVRPPLAPPLLLLGSYRTDERDRSALLRALLAGHGTIARRHHDLEMQPLSLEEAEELATALLDRAAVDRSSAATIARESGGNPYFVHELVRFAQVAGPRPGERVGLEDVIRARVARCEQSERDLLEVVAVASKPLPQRVAHEAAGIDVQERARTAQQLVGAQLARTSGGRDRDAIECYHDRIRETVVAGLAPQALRDWHHRLADALEAEGGADPETLVEHLQAAGENERAAAYALQAAQQAAASLSFLHAARLFGVALELRPDAPAEERLALLGSRGDALANAGRGFESAGAYLEAAEQTEDTERRRELRRRAAEQYLRAGYVKEGLEIVRELFQALGIRFPSSAAATIASLLYHRAALRLRGLHFEERDPAEVSDRQRMIADLLATTGTGLVQIDALRGSLFCSRAVREAFKTGDRERASQAVLLEALMISSGGARTRKEAERHLAAAEEIARPIASSHSRALQLSARGVVAFELGDFADAFEICERGLAEFRRGASGSYWELGTTELFSALAQLWGARFDDTSRLTPARLSAAQERGDLYTVTCLRAAITPIIHLIADDPEAAHREGDEALAQWRVEEFQNQHYMAFVAKSFIDLYTGDMESAVKRCEETAAHMRSSLLKHVQIIRGTWRLSEGLCLIEAARQDRSRADGWLRTARRNARRLSREGAVWCDGGAAALEAGLAFRAGDRERGLERLEHARELFGRCGMDIFGDACAWRIAAMRGDEEGTARAREIEERWRGRGIVRPARLLDGVAVSP